MAAIVRTVGDKLMGTAARLYQNALGSQLAQYGACDGRWTGPRGARRSAWGVGQAGSWCAPCRGHVGPNAERCS